MAPIAAVRGTHDILPAQAHAWEWLHRTHERVAGGFGYRPVETPVLEHTELFERGVGAGTDVVDKEMYTFTDAGGRSLTLRPEGTAGVVRAVMAAHLLDATRPLRLRYAGPMFRRERPQKGRHRQFHQLGIECLGDPAPHLDVEVIEVGVRFLEAVGLHGVSIQVNSLGDRDDRARFRAALVAHYTPLRDRLCEDCRRRLAVNPLRLLDCKRDADLAEGAPRLADLLGAASERHFAEVLAGLEDAGIASTRNHRLVRGLDYYCHTTFELWHTSLRGAQNALAGGGRYDGLAEELGFPGTPGVGYAIGMERLLSLLAEEGAGPASLPAAAAVVCSLAPAQGLAAAACARGLRAAGVATVLDAADRKLGAKLRAAASLGARWAVLVGEVEVATGAVALKDLATQEQETVPAGRLAARLRGGVEDAAG